jgi:hypothetical protein
MLAEKMGLLPELPPGAAVSVTQYRGSEVEVEVWELLIKRVPITDRRFVPIKAVSIIANGLSRAPTNPLFNSCYFLRRGRLFKEVRDAGPIITPDVVGRASTAKVTIGAFTCDVIHAGHVQRVSVGECRHVRRPYSMILHESKYHSKILVGSLGSTSTLRPPAPGWLEKTRNTLIPTLLPREEGKLSLDRDPGWHSVALTLG